MTQTETSALALDLMTNHGLLAKGWHFAFNNRKRGLGLCSYRKQTIYVSTYHVALNPDDEVRDTILHEIAHALAGGFAGHGRIWKLQAMAIGARPQACAMLSKTLAMPAGSYFAVCGVCKARRERYRKPKANRRWACPCNRALPFAARELFYQSV